MNEPAIRREEQIISLFPERETLVCRGWILKKMGRCLFVYPLYYQFSQGNIPDNIQKCEEISRQSGIDCVFRIVEYTNYHLSSILTDNGYGLKRHGVVGELRLRLADSRLCEKKTQCSRLFLKEENDRENAGYLMTEQDAMIGIRRRGLLFLPNGNLPDCVGLDDILRFSRENGITQILADIPGREELPEQYGRAGFRRAYLYRCYQKLEEKSSEKDNSCT